MADALLAFRNVRADYGEAVILDDVSFEVAEHDSLAVLGRNGVRLHAARSPGAGPTSHEWRRITAPAQASAGSRRSVRSFQTSRWRKISP